MRTTPPSPADEVASKRTPSGLVASWVLFAATAAAPALFGARDPATVACLCVLLGIGAMAAPTQALPRGLFKWLIGVSIIAAAYGFVLSEQLAKVPRFAHYDPIWAQASAVLGIALEPSASITRYEPIFALGGPISAALAFCLGLICGANRVMAARLIGTVRWSALLYAIVGLAQTAISPNLILWRDRVGYIGAVTGPFINANTAGVYFAMGAIAWLVTLCDEMTLTRARLEGGRTAVRWRFDRGQLAPGFALFLCTTAMLMSGSRAGSFLGLLGILCVYLRFDAGSERSLAIRLLTPLLVVAGLVQVVGGVLFGRIGVLGLNGGGRLEVYEAALKIIADHPWFGTGLGTFAQSFPAYRPAALPLWGVWDLAHSTPLEIAVEGGLPLAALVILGWICLLTTLFVSFLRSSSRVVRVACPVAFIAAIHTSIDFSMQTTGFAVPVMALAGAGLSAAARQAGISRASPGGGIRRTSASPPEAASNSE